MYNTIINFVISIIMIFFFSLLTYLSLRKTFLLKDRVVDSTEKKRIRENRYSGTFYAVFISNANIIILAIAHVHFITFCFHKAFRETAYTFKWYTVYHVMVSYYSIVIKLVLIIIIQSKSHTRTNIE